MSTSAYTRRRAALLDAMADHMLANGLAGSPLRALGAAARTSDRMLLYYFADKGDLLTALFEHLATRLTGLLSGGDQGERSSYAELLSSLWTATSASTLRPYMLVFLELAAAAGRGEEPHRSAAGRVVQGFGVWVADRLDAPEGERAGLAVLLLATLDGLFLLDSAGRREDADLAAATAIANSRITSGDESK